MEQIFEPGFSTKINYETGEVNRGLGLSLVKDFIELRLGGTHPGNFRSRKNSFHTYYTKREMERFINEILSH